jgi:hypothetical protein
VGGLVNADLLIVVLIADAVQNAGGYRSITEDVALAAVIFGWATVIDRLDFKFPRLHIAAARELPVVRNGRFLRRNMAREQVGRGVDERVVEVEGDRVHAFHERVPYLLLKACAALGIAPRELLFVGDSSLDAAAARAAGCPVVLVDYGYNRGRPACDAGADAVIASLLELAA